MTKGCCKVAVIGPMSPPEAVEQGWHEMDQGTRRATERTNQACTPEARATSSCRRDNGFSLVEVLVSIVLLGTAGVVILGAVGASAQGATTQGQQADSQAVIAAGSEVLMGIKPVACTSAASTYLPQST